MTLAPACFAFKWDGAAAAVVLFAIPLAVLITTLTLWLYRKAVERSMRASAGERVPADSPLAPQASAVPPLQISVSGEGGPPATARMQESRAAMRELSRAYALAGFAQSLVVTVLWFVLNDVEFRPARSLIAWLPYAWPIVLGLMLTATTTRRQRYAMIGGYFAILLIADAGAEVAGLRYKPGFGELFLLWASVMAPPTLVIALLSNRAWRSVGLFALFLGVALSLSYQLGFQALACLALSTRSSVLFGSFDYLLWSLVLACFASAAWILARVARRYEARRTSDQMLVLDSWWLLVTLFAVLFQLGTSGLTAFTIIFAFVAYKAVLHIALPRLASSSAAGTPQSLLLLRVFGYTRRTRTLIDQVGQFWRHNGPINMIGGADLAASLIEPDELAQFWTGGLRRRFIANAADLQSRLQAIDSRRDPDGRYRINEFFCHDDTWQAVVRGLAQRSEAVLMDLRSFGRKNRGCEFELGLLLHEVPLARIVLLIDSSTRREDLEPLLQSVWSRLPDTSPNHGLRFPALQLMQAADESATFERVMSRLFACAERGDA